MTSETALQLQSELDYSLFPRPLSPHHCRPRSPEMKYENMDWVPEEYPELPAHDQVFAETTSPYTCMPVTQQTIICGDGVKSTTAVEVVGEISGFADPDKAVYEVIYNATKCIAKCWSPKLFNQ